MTNITHYTLNNRPTTRYISATTVREEALDSTRLIGLYWSSSGYIQKENITASLPGLAPIIFPIHAFELEIDGQSLHNRWQWVSAVERNNEDFNVCEGVITLQHQIRPVTLQVVTRLDDTPFLVRSLEITNTGVQTAALSNVSPMSGMLWNTTTQTGQLSKDLESPFTIGYFDNDTCQGAEGNFKWKPLQRGIKRFQSITGASGWGCPYFIVRNEVTGECAILSLAWSGNWFAEFRFDPHLDLENTPTQGVNLSFRMGPSGPAPLRLIEPGELIITPELHIGLTHTALDDSIAALHEHIRTSVSPPRPKRKQYFVTAGRVIEEPGDWILREIDIAADMGIQHFMIDAGWYGERFKDWWMQTGDWSVGDWIPGGLSQCRERVHKHGMLFGLWMEPETVGPESRIKEEHPEWLLAYDGDKQLPMLNLSHPEAAQHFTESILRVIREHKLDCFKLDYNSRPYEGGQQERKGYLEHESWRHYEVLYSTFKEVRRQFPDVVLEDCASGGGRIDLGMLSCFHFACESDFSDFPRNIRAINGLTLFVPPECLCYYHNLFPYAHQKADADTLLRVALFAHPIFVGFGAQDVDRTDAYSERTKRYIQLIKDFTGPILNHKPYVYHHTPNIGVQSPADWCVLEYAAQDNSAGYTGVFRTGASPMSQEYVIRLRGVNPSRHYSVTFDNQETVISYSGLQLQQDGIRVQLEQPNTSELLLYEICNSL